MTKPAKNHPWRQQYGRAIAAKNKLNKFPNVRPSKQAKPRDMVRTLAEQLEDEELEERLETVNGMPLWVDEY